MCRCVFGFGAAVRAARHAGLGSARDRGGGDGDVIARVRVAGSCTVSPRAVGGRFGSVASGTGRLRRFGFGRLRQVDDRCHHGACGVAVGFACRCARLGPHVWKPIRSAGCRCPARYGDAYRTVGGGRACRAGYRGRIDARRPGRHALGTCRGPREGRAHGTSGGAIARCFASRIRRGLC